MTRNHVAMLVAGAGLTILTGCQSGGMSAGMRITATHNPTVLAGRGEPSLEDQMRPAAWIFVDGKPGEFEERNGSPVVGWHIHEPVAAAPKFQLAVFKPLLGEKIGVNLVLVKEDEPDEDKPDAEGLEIKPDDTVFYGLGGREEGVSIQKSYDLIHPGDAFVIRDLRKPERPIVDNIDPLAPGHYALAASVTNLESGQNTLTITYFEVGE